MSTLVNIIFKDDNEWGENVNFCKQRPWIYNITRRFITVFGILEYILYTLGECFENAYSKCTCFHIARRPTLSSRYILFTRVCGELSRKSLIIVCNFSLHYREGIARNSAAYRGGKTRWFSEDFLLRVSGKFLLQISEKFPLALNKSSADTDKVCFPPVEYCIMTQSGPAPTFSKPASRFHPDAVLRYKSGCLWSMYN